MAAPSHTVALAKGAQPAPHILLWTADVRAGLEELLTPMLEHSEVQMEAVLSSQQKLSGTIDRLVSGALLLER
jgi:hypothetical protein